MFFSTGILLFAYQTRSTCCRMVEAVVRSVWCYLPSAREHGTGCKTSTYINELHVKQEVGAPFLIPSDMEQRCVTCHEVTAGN